MFSYAQGAYTPNSITSVLDHHMDKPYGHDGIVLAFTGEKGEGEAKENGCYPPPKDSQFSIHGLYRGTEKDGCGPTGGLNYDGHPGYDYYAESGAPVYAAAPGTVIRAGNQRSGEVGRCIPKGIDKDGCEAWGFVGIDHGNGYVTQYGHLSEILIEAGQKIRDRQLIGFTGNKAPDGIFLSPHLHFEVLKRHEGTPYGYAFVDPYGWERSPGEDYLGDTIYQLILLCHIS